MSNISLQDGSSFQDKYLIQSRNLSRKNSCQIYRVLNNLNQREEVIKIDFEHKTKLKNEFLILHKLQGFKTFPEIFSSDFDKQPNYFTEEAYFSDVGLVLKKLTKLDLDSTVSIYSQLLSQLYILHSNGFIHGNICPANVAIDYSKIKITFIDFSNAIDFNAVKANQNEVKQKGEISCSFASISAHNGIRSARDDLESLGYMLVYMLTGKLPWKGQFPKKSFNK